MPSNSLSRYDANLIAHPSFEEGYEESVVPVLIQGSDKSGMNRDLFFQITSLPENGVLVEPDSERIIKAGDVLNQTDSYPWAGIVVHYKGNENFFTSPQKHEESVLETERTYETFQFAVMAPMPNEVAIGTSSPVSNNVTIVNINDAPVLKIPAETQLVNMFSSINWNPTCEDGDDGEKSIVSVLDKECTEDNIIKGINVKDPDKGMNYVRVDVKSTHGIISLNQDYLQTAEFVGCSTRNVTNSTWKCQGNGVGNNEMTFISSPNHLNSLFSHMLYESLTEGYDDITLSIYDGVGGDCLSKDEHMIKYKLNNVTGPYTINSPNNDNNSTCQKVEKLIPVHIVKKEKEETSKGLLDEILGDIPIQLWVAMIALVVSVVSVLFFRINCGKGKKRSKKRSKTRKGRDRSKGKVKRSKNRRKRGEDKRKYDAEGMVSDIVEECSTAHSTKKKHAEEDLDSLEENEITFGGSSEREDYDDFDEEMEGGYDEEMEGEDYYDEGEGEGEEEGEEEFLGDDYDEDEGEQEVSSCEWIQYFDSSSGDNYYENMRTRRVTWTKPNEPCINGDNEE